MREVRNSDVHCAGSAFYGVLSAMLLRRAGNLFSEKKAIGDVPAMAAKISARGRAAIDALSS